MAPVADISITVHCRAANPPSSVIQPGCCTERRTSRFFVTAIWVPGRTAEAEELEHFKRPPVDPDKDGVITFEEGKEKTRMELVAYKKD